MSKMGSFLGENGPGCEAEHSIPTSSRIKNMCSFMFTSPCLHGVVLNEVPGTTLPHLLSFIEQHISKSAYSLFIQTTKLL
jgi:hypothetical protein